MWLCSEEDEPVPLNYLPPDKSSISDWVLDKVKEIKHFVKVMKNNLWLCLVL